MAFGIDDALIISAAIGAGSNLLGGFLGQSGQAAANSEMMRFNANQSFQQMMFQERMRNTAYQVAMYDMKQAGLNPILAANLGGAAVPSGSAASVNLGNAGAFLGQGVSNAGQVGQRFLDAKATLAQAQKDASVVPMNEANVGLTRAQTGLAEKSQGQVDANIVNINADTANKLAQNPNITADTANKLAENARIQAEAVTAQRVAQDTTLYGASPVGQAIGGILRSLDTIINGKDPRITDAQKAAARAAKAGLQTLQERAGNNSPSPSPSPSAPPMLRDDPGHWLYKQR